MKNEKILADEILSDDELENVVGGYRSDFEAVCQALGKHPSFNTLNDIRSILAKEYSIGVDSWNTGSKVMINLRQLNFSLCDLSMVMTTQPRDSL